MVSIFSLCLQHLIAQALLAESNKQDLIDFLRNSTQTGGYLDANDCRQLAELLEVKRRKGRPGTRMGQSTPYPKIATAVMFRFARNCASIGLKDGFSNRAEAKDETCKAFGICQRDFEAIHSKNKHYVTELENKIRQIDKTICRDLEENRTVPQNTQ